MKLSAIKVLELNERYHLVEGLSERETQNPEGVELELRVGRVFRIKKGQGFLGIEKRASPEIEEITPTERENGRWITMGPGDYYLVETMERVSVPGEKVKVESGLHYLCADVRPRSSLQRCGIALYCTTTNPGYTGTLTFGLANLGREDFSFEIGARMFKIFFEQVVGEIARAYSGQHQGGRVSSQGAVENQN